jgi:hypothetical protein
MTAHAKLNLPEFQFRYRKNGIREEIFDVSRRRYVALTPEEWVRQNFLMYLNLHLEFPLSLIAVEKKILVNRMPKRFDIVVFLNNGYPKMLIECKSPFVQITQDVLDQAGRYNLTLNVPYLCVTNGLNHLCCHWNKQKGDWIFLEHIPMYNQL